MGRGKSVYQTKKIWQDVKYEHAQKLFEIGTDKSLFDGLYISRNKELCDMHMGKYPVISITLKGIEGMTFEEARNMLKIILKMKRGDTII